MNGCVCHRGVVLQCHVDNHKLCGVVGIDKASCRPGQFRLSECGIFNFQRENLSGVVNDEINFGSCLASPMFECTLEGEDLLYFAKNPVFEKLALVCS